MPTDPPTTNREVAPRDKSNSSAGSRADRVMRRHRSHAETVRERATRYRDDMEVDGVLPVPTRDRLYDLFGQIEKEFEHLYASNLALQEQVETLSGQLGEASCGEVATVAAGPLESNDATEYSSKNKKSLLSQRIKTTYKQSTSKLVSSFRTAAPAYSMVREFRGHRDGVWEVSVSRSQGQQVIASAAVDHSARIFSIESGHCLMRYTGHRGSVNAVRFHPTQDLALTSSGDGTAHIWRATLPNGTNTEALRSQSSGEDEIEGSEREDQDEGMDDSAIVRSPILEFSHHSDVVSAADWMCDGCQVTTASWDRRAILADAETGDEVCVLSGHDQEINDVHTHPSQRLVLTSSKDTTFRLWDFRGSAMCVNVFQGHNQQVTSSVFASGEKIVSGSDDRSVKVWDMRSMRSPMAAIRTDSEVNRLSVSQAHNIIAISHDNRNIRLYDMNGVRIGRLPRNNRQGHSRMVCSVAWADHNSSCNLFSCGFDRKVLGWMVSVTGKE